MKIALYGICKNELAYVDRLLDTAKDADLVLIADTGSTDGTVERLKERGVEVHEIMVSPFRFDLARQHALSLLPDDVDVAVSVDMDEVLTPNWREVIERHWEVGKTTMLRYPYIHAWEDEAQTIPRITMQGFKVHCPKSYMWKYPLHEILEPIKEENLKLIDEQILIHYPDWTKEERGTRIDIIAREVKDNPQDERMAHLYGRELWLKQRWEEAIEALLHHLDITKAYTVEDMETRASTCTYIAKCFMSLSNDTKLDMTTRKQNAESAVVWLQRAVGEHPYQRGTWLTLADAWMTLGDYASAYACAVRGLAIKNRNASSETYEWFWDERADKLLDEAKAKMLESVGHV